MAKPEIPDFGILWPPNIPLLQRHLYCARHNRGNGAFFHRRALLQALWPEDAYAWHDWSDRRLKSTCDYSMVTWVGAGSTGKSCDAAAQALEWFWEEPDNTAIIIASTTVKMLKIRIWSELQRLFSSLPRAVEFRDESGQLIERTNLGYLGELIDSETMLRWKPGDNKHAIFGLAVGDGPVHEAVQNLVGIHARRVWLILDELQGVREAIMSATKNMSKNPVFRLLGMGNPESNKDLLRRKSEPINGWGSIDPTKLDGWDTNGGIVAAIGRCERFDGRKSPAIANPKKFYFLINQKQIDDHIREAGGNLNDPSLNSQSFGIWPPIGVESTVLDDAIITKFKCKSPARWTNGFSNGAALDPAFTEGGNRKILQFFKYAVVNDDEGSRWVIELGDWLDVPVDSSLLEEPIHYQIMEFCKSACEAKGITSDEFALDSSGEGGGLKAIFDREWGVVMGIEFGGSPSDTPQQSFKTVNGQRVQQTAKDVFDRRVSELNHTVRNFALGNGLRGLSDDAAEQACARKTIYKNKKNTVQSKKDMRDFTGDSPDNLDAVAVACAYAQAQGARPGGEVIRSRRTQSVMDEMAEENRRMLDESSYLVTSW